jgi:lipopolysaccharide/colanic/teichoic acid biosynthesis glycosyltransferase
MLDFGEISELEQKYLFEDIEEILRKKKFQMVSKRIFDIIFSICGIVLLSPLLVIISIIVKLDSRGPVFFRQIRVGKDLNEFKILKFRTMTMSADISGMQITVGKDKRITKSGNFLRNLKLDELPQLINVLTGDMSFVGPRPEVPKYVQKYNKEQKLILKIKPGITDLASIEYRDESNVLAQSEEPEQTYINEVMPHKIQLNILYLKNASVLFDIKLIIKTMYVILTK